MKMTMKKVAAVIAAAVPLMTGPVLAGDLSKRSTMTQSETEQSHQTMSCGEHMATEAASMEKRAALITQVADTYAAHAQWLGDGAAAKQERAALMKLSKSFRDLGKQVRTISRELAQHRDLKPAPHDMQNTAAISRVTEAQMKMAKLQQEVADDLRQSAQQLQIAAQQLQSTTGTGGSGPQQMEDPEPEWPKTPEEELH